MPQGQDLVHTTLPPILTEISEHSEVRTEIECVSQRHASPLGLSTLFH